MVAALAPLLSTPQLASKQPRDRGNGQYVTYLEALCICGHSLGDHTAARVDGEQPCVLHECDGCMCRSFKKARATKAVR